MLLQIALCTGGFFSIAGVEVTVSRLAETSRQASLRILPAVLPNNIVKYSQLGRAEEWKQ